MSTDLHSYDTRDAQEHADVAAALEELAADHPAREAYARGACTIELTHLLADHPELVEGLTEAFLAGYRRVLVGTDRFRPG